MTEPRRPERHPRTSTRALRVLVCDGCCCGTARKHPDTDHAAQRHEIAAAVRGRGTVEVVGCLGRCDRSNVVVVRRRGQAARWLGPVLTPETTAVVTDWLRSGAPDPPPAAVQALCFDRFTSSAPAVPVTAPVPTPTRRST